jgi:hypothetical protein
MLGAGLSDDRAVLYMPDIRISIPILESLAIEYLGPSHMVIKINRLGLDKVEGRRRVLRRICLLCDNMCRTKPGDKSYR